MDEADYGNEYAEFYLRDALRQCRGRHSGMPRGESQTCIDCGERIPEERLEAMRQLGIDCMRCVACQHAFERER